MIFLAILKGCSSRFWAITIAVNCFRLKLPIGIIVGYVASSLAWCCPYPGACHWVGRYATDNSSKKTTRDFLEFPLGVAVAGCGHYGNVNDLSKLEILHWHDCGMYSTKFGMIPSISQFMDAALR